MEGNEREREREKEMRLTKHETKADKAEGWRLGVEWRGGGGMGKDRDEAVNKRANGRQERS